MSHKNTWNLIPPPKNRRDDDPRSREASRRGGREHWRSELSTRNSGNSSQKDDPPGHVTPEQYKMLMIQSERDFLKKYERETSTLHQAYEGVEIGTDLPEKTRRCDLRIVLFVSTVLLGLSLFSVLTGSYLNQQESKAMETKAMETKAMETKAKAVQIESDVDIESNSDKTTTQPSVKRDEGDYAQIFHHRRVANSSELTDAIIEAVNKYKHTTGYTRERTGNFEYSAKKVDYSRLDIEITLNSWLQTKDDQKYDPMFDVLFYNCCCYMETSLFLCSGNVINQTNKNGKKLPELKCYILYSDGEWKWIINFDNHDNIGYLLYESRCVLTITSNKRFE